MADVTALAAAGADSIWLDAEVKPQVKWFIELGALVAITHRVRLGLIGSPPASATLNVRIE